MITKDQKTYIEVREDVLHQGRIQAGFAERLSPHPTHLTQNVIFIETFWINLINLGYSIYPRYYTPYTLSLKLLFNKPALLPMNECKIAGWVAV